LFGTIIITFFESNYFLIYISILIGLIKTDNEYTINFIHQTSGFFYTLLYRGVIYMSIDIIVIYSFSFLLLFISFIKNKQKTFKALIKAKNTFVKLMPVLLPLFLFIGILLTLITPELIAAIFGGENGIFGYAIALILGSITFMSPFVAYPLGAELIEKGASIPLVAGFLVTLMSVGLVYFSMESKMFNKKVTIYRNVVSFIGAIVVIIVVILVGVS
jgi:uncharacterized membrane protein YraQ (UPF0718 family)